MDGGLDHPCYKIQTRNKQIEKRTHKLMLSARWQLDANQQLSRGIWPEALKRLVPRCEIRNNKGTNRSAFTIPKMDYK